jgi:signal transduction histidine kinase
MKDRPSPKTNHASWVVPTAIGLAVADSLTGIAGAVFFALVDWHRVPAALQPNASDLANAFPVLIASAVGGLVAIRRPNNIMGWLLLLICLTSNLLSVPPIYAAYALYVHPGLPLANWGLLLSVATWPLLIGLLLVVLPLLFPDGRLLSRRWMVPIVLYGGFIVLNLVVALDPASTAPVRNPIGVKALSGVGQIVNSPPFLIVFVLLCCPGVAGLFVRYRRGTQQEREQLKWLLGAIVLLLLAVVVQSLVPPLSNAPLIPLAAVAMPIAIGIAVLRYRLYDIDLIINKALVYGGLAALITATYVLVVIGIGALVGSSRQFLLSIIATLLIAVSFHPLRQRTQQLANRLIYGRRATPYETLSQFSEHLSETFSQEDILDRMSRILAQATGAERAEVWVRSGSQLLLASSSPASTLGLVELAMADGTLPAMERDQVVPVFHQGQLLGALTVIKKRGETMNPVELKLLADLAAQAGLVLRNVGLNRELMARLQDLRASRQRLVTAQDEERRRIERDLHDGAQQHLVALKVKVGLAQAARDEEKKTRLLAELKQDADAAIDQLRELARGVYPPLLASDGLEAALRGHLRRSTVAVELDVTPPPRQPRELESAVYFCCLEALQNVSKYAEASKVRIRLWTEASTLGFAVEDDGKGFDLSRARDIHGIENMRDRLEALGGTLTVSSAPGEGTRVVGLLPMSVVTAGSLVGTEA